MKPLDRALPDEVDYFNVCDKKNLNKKKENKMKNVPVVKDRRTLVMNELENTHEACQLLLATPHYQKLGKDGIYAIYAKAESVGVNPMEALNGGMYFVQGKVEMTSSMMNQLIRAQRHSITKDKKSDQTICILHGKRADNGDTWVESFSIEDAKQAGIYRNQWLKYPKDMLFARALSRLARQLFPDVIKGCYVQGEIADAPALDSSDVVVLEESVVDVPTKVAELSSDNGFITEEEATRLDGLIGEDEEYRGIVMNFLMKHHGTDSLLGMTRIIYSKILPVASEKYDERQASAQQLVYGETEQMAIGG